MRTYELNILFGCSDIASSYNDSPDIFIARDVLSLNAFFVSFVGLTVLATRLLFVSVSFSERVLFEEEKDNDEIVSGVSSTGSCLIYKI